MKHRLYCILIFYSSTGLLESPSFLSLTSLQPPGVWADDLSRLSGDVSADLRKSLAALPVPLQRPIRWMNFVWRHGAAPNWNPASALPTYQHGETVNAHSDWLRPQCQTVLCIGWMPSEKGKIHCLFIKQLCIIRTAHGLDTLGLNSEVILVLRQCSTGV